MARNFKIQGKEQNLTEGPLISEFNHIVKTYKIETVRSKADIIDVAAEPDDIIALEFEDGGEWIGPAEDIEKIFGEHIQLSRDGNELFPMSIRSSVGSDRGIQEIGLKLLHLIKRKAVKNISEQAAEKLGLAVDRFVLKEPGLFKVNKSGSLIKTSLGKKPEHYLLFLHGTISSFDGSFGGLYDTDTTGISDLIFNTYGDRVLALQHYTLSQSPFQNAIDLLEAIPEGSTFDIISHSRGGLIADILAIGAIDNTLPGFTPDNLTLAEKANDDKELAQSLIRLNQLIKIKKYKVNKVIRVASPAQGTVLLNSGRLDFFLNGVLRALGLIFGNLNPIYQYIKGFICDVATAGLETEALPGLRAMVPESIAQQLINRPFTTVKSQLAVIAGDAEMGRNWANSIKVAFTNLYFGRDNDFVVNTDSMHHGSLREQGLYIFLSQNNETSHFKYFKNQNTQQALAYALITESGKAIKGFDYLSSATDRGVLLDKFIHFEGEYRDEISGKKPIVLLLPGVMGTHLSIAGRHIWADLGEIGKGRLVRELHADNKNVEAKELIGEYYTKICDYLKPTHDVYTFGYDWRLSLREAAIKLEATIKKLTTHDQPIVLLAHSMGGLVAREVMRLHKTSWKEYLHRKGSRLILLGTPWLGSHVSMQVLTGHHKKVRQLGLMDTSHTRDELISVFNKYPGIYEILPLVDSHKIEDETSWQKINTDLGKDKIQIPPLLKEFKDYKTKVLQFDKKVDLTNVYYVAGHGEQTACDYRVISNFWGPKLQYLGTPEGDGTVTYQLGIPKNLDRDNLYFAHNTTHGELANDKALFDAIKDLIDQGKTQHIALQKSAPTIQVSRSVVDLPDIKNVVPMPEEPIFNRTADMASVLLDREIPGFVTKKGFDQLIDVRVVHGDLRYARYPVMVGHFRQDGITSAEWAIDECYDGKLTERAKVGRYPGLIGDSLVLFDPFNNPKGAIVIGLGEITELTPFQLRKSVEAGTLNYAMHIRDNVIRDWLKDEERVEKDIETSITCLCIGSGFGRLPMDEALHAILLGVQNANRLIATLKDLKTIQHIEFIELFEHVAQNAYYQLSRLMHNNNNLSIRLTKKIEPKTGARKRFQFENENSWWHNFTTRLVEDPFSAIELEREGNKKRAAKINKRLPRLHFTSASGIARVAEENTFTAQNTVQALLAQLSDQSVWNAEYSKTLFEILVPNAFKEIIRQQNNILWKMDVDTAAYPWEMFHDHEVDREPTFVRAGLIRQLYSGTVHYEPDIIRSETALVIANPIYSPSGPPPLPAAELEGKIVHKLLKAVGYSSIDLLHKSSLEILNALYNKEYKILHIAAHGIVSDHIHETGIVLGDGIYITPPMLKNMSRLPEFVFINCCYSGAMDASRERYYHERYKFAANVGTQLIEMGVNAVVIAGWPVNDAAAEVFARSLYTALLAGDKFGTAVQKARKETWDHSGSSNNTWGAYQCYGDQWYRLVNESSSKLGGDEYFMEDQVLADLYNLKDKSRSERIKSNKQETYKADLERIIKKAKQAGLYKGAVNEKEADILSELNQVEESIDRYQALLKQNKADFSVKALEQYCNLRIKALLPKGETVHPKKQDLEKLSINIKNLIHDFETLTLIGKTPERLSLMGSAYKKLFVIRSHYRFTRAQAVPAALVLLKQAGEYYQHAYQASSELNLQEQIYPLTNWLIIHAMTKQGLTAVINGKKQELPKFLNDLDAELKKEVGKHIDFWEDIALINLRQCKLFYTSSPKLFVDSKSPKDKISSAKKIELINKLILTRYAAAWKLSGTLKQLQAEKEQVDFMLKGLEVMQGDESWKVKMKRGLVEMRRGLEELG